MQIGSTLRRIVTRSSPRMPLARRMLSEAAGLPTATSRYITGPFGKPAIAPGCGHGGLCFNISHTRGLAACAVTREDEFSFDVEPSDRPTDLAFQATIFANGNGVPPTTGVNIVYNASLGGAKLDLLAISPSTGNADLALDGAIYHRNLVEGRDIVTDAALTGAMKAPPTACARASRRSNSRVSSRTKVR